MDVIERLRKQEKLTISSFFMKYNIPITTERLLKCGRYLAEQYWINYKRKPVKKFTFTKDGRMVYYNSYDWEFLNKYVGQFKQSS